MKPFWEKKTQKNIVLRPFKANKSRPEPSGQHKLNQSRVPGRLRSGAQRIWPAQGLGLLGLENKPRAKATELYYINMSYIYIHTYMEL